MSNQVRSPETAHRRVALATFVGTTIEYYDFFVFGTVSALVFAQVFFAPAPDSIALLLAMATFGVSFVFRPVGGFIAGHLGDRYGRKPVLLWTMSVMGVASILIGVLPTYAAIGIAAPLLLILLRIVQGVSVGGEWGGAATLAVENAPANRRGLWGTMPQLGGMIGVVMANATTLIVAAAVDPQAFIEWGWRVPFLLNVLFLGLGLWIRAQVADQVGQSVKENPELRPKNPLRQVLAGHLGVTLKLVGAQAGINITFYIIIVLSLTYLTTYVGVDSTVALTAVLVAVAVDALMIPIWGRLSDRIGRRPLIIIGAAVSALLMPLYFWVTSSGDPLLIILISALVLGAGHAPAFAVLSVLVAEQYPAEIRYSGASVAVQVGNLVWSAGTPLVGVLLLSQSGGSGWPLIVLLGVGCALAIICAASLKETHLMASIARVPAASEISENAVL